MPNLKTTDVPNKILDIALKNIKRLVDADNFPEDDDWIMLSPEWEMNVYIAKMGNVTLRKGVLYPVEKGTVSGQKFVEIYSDIVEIDEPYWIFMVPVGGYGFTEEEAWEDVLQATPNLHGFEMPKGEKQE